MSESPGSNDYAKHHAAVLLNKRIQGIMPDNWQDQLRERFPDWLTSKAIMRFLEMSEQNKRPFVGDLVSGEVIAVAPFGVWVDVNWGFPALLLAANMLNVEGERISEYDYPKLGTIIHAEITSLDVEGEIKLIQTPDPDAAT